MNLEGHVTATDSGDIIGFLSKMVRLCLEASWNNDVPAGAQKILSDKALLLKGKIDVLINEQFHASAEQFKDAATELQGKVNDIKERIARLNKIADALELTAQISTIVDDAVAIAAGLAKP